MSRLTDSPAWHALARHQAQLDGVRVRDLFAADPARFQRHSAEAAGLLVDWSKQRVTDETLSLLIALADSQDLAGWRDRLFAGAPINASEGRAVLHVALRNRSGTPMPSAEADVMPAVGAVLAQLGRFVDAVRYGSWTGHTRRQIKDVVHLGIGGSHLGPEMVCEALRPYHHPDLRVRFVSNVDATDLLETLAWLDPETTLFVIASKTFTTQETMANAHAARTWFLDEGGSEQALDRHFAAVTANPAAARAFGVAPEAIFEFWDWVGGRTSLWSAVGLPTALAIGMNRFEELLDGAHALDQHFRTAPFARNLPVILGLIGVWNINFWGMTAHAVLPYDQYLALLPAHLQQLDMESNGKSVDRDGRPVDYPTGPVLFGAPGSNGQHAFHQLLHQGPQPVPADFIGVAASHNPLLGPAGWHHDLLCANLLAQSAALMAGRPPDETRAAAPGVTDPALIAQRSFDGNRPSTTILLPKLDPATLGALLALYEHKIFVQSVIWNINAFDQWGVELGKQLAGPILRALAEDEPDPAAPPCADADGSTRGLIEWLRRHR